MSRFYSPSLSQPTVPVNVGLSKLQLTQSADTFKVLLGVEYVLYVKLQNFHWNITGMSFYGLHKLFGKQYEKLAKFIDQLAEKIRQYGDVSPGSMQEFLVLNERGSGTAEIIGATSGQVQIINLAIASHDAVAQFIHSLDVAKLDLSSQDLLGSIYDFHLKSTWMLRAHLQ